MGPPLFVLVALVLVPFCKGNTMVPDFTLIDKNQDYEERSYVETRWISTEITSTWSGDVIAAVSRLDNYCKKQKAQGNQIAGGTWPVLVGVRESENGTLLTMSWFLSPGDSITEDNDPSITLLIRPAGIVYVRRFGGAPSVEAGEGNANTLRQVLAQAGKNFDPDFYAGASYEPYLSLIHHNEIWISAL